VSGRQAKRARSEQREQRERNDLSRLGAYWHGGPAGLTGKILPPAATGKTGYVGGGRDDRVYITPRVSFATLYACHYREPMLYAVWPDSEPEPDPEIAHLVQNARDARDSLMTSSATILFTRSPSRDEIDTAQTKLTASFVAAGVPRGAALAMLCWDPPPSPPCELCTAEQLTPRLHEDNVCWVALCETCDVPMVVWKQHGTDPSGDELDHMGRHLGRIAESFFGSAWHVDTSMRSIPDHFHAHARATTTRTTEPSPSLPLRVCSLPEAIDVVESDPPRAIVSLVNSADAVPFRHERHLLRECLDIHLPGDPMAAGAAEVDAVIDFAQEIGPEPGVLVHCDMGMSRSTAAAWIMLITWEWDPAEALEALAAAHPAGRPFMPNAMMTEAAATALAERGLIPKRAA
jgi:predicted protein tyrosine phosphatase